MGGADELRLARVVRQGASKLGNEHRQVRVDDEGAGPDAGVERGLVQHVGAVLDQQAQQIEGLRRQMDLRALTAEPPGVGVEREIGESNLHGTTDL